MVLMVLGAADHFAGTCPRNRRRALTEIERDISYGRTYLPLYWQFRHAPESNADLIALMGGSGAAGTLPYNALKQQVCS